MKRMAAEPSTPSTDMRSASHKRAKGRNNILIIVVALLFIALALGMTIFLSTLDDEDYEAEYAEEYATEYDYEYPYEEPIETEEAEPVVPIEPTPTPAPPEPRLDVGVYKFHEEPNGFTGINIITAEAFTPQEDATYRLFVEYVIRGTFGIEALWIHEGDTTTRLVRRGNPYTSIDATTTPIAQGLPVMFLPNANASEGESAWLRADISYEDLLEHRGIALRGLNLQSGIEFIQTKIYRLGDEEYDIPDEILVHWTAKGD
ncbi:MAG: hypothetical protein FWC89_12040 [Defluviitaleaceae bacterium]|nr:hypothetical protein [Defluviitaleaceae bacterium]